MPKIATRFLDKYGKMTFARYRGWLALSLFLLSGALLFRYALGPRGFSEEVLIYDAIWLDAWSLGFVLTLACIWVSRLSWQTKAWLGIMALSIYGCVEIALILDGTPFSSNSYWGDQKFRQAMILKFITFGWPSDFYYKDLPIFYPPLLYMVLAWVAKLFLVPAYAMMKAGGLAIYLAGPALSFLLWRRLVGPLQAWLIVLFTFLICSFPTPYPLAAPHAFVATVIFIPWWLHFVEGVKLRAPSLFTYLAGSLLGAVIAATYFYPFFVGAVVLVLRLFIIRRPDNFRWRHAIIILVGSLLLSSWYWLPVVWSIAANGLDRSRGGWHHIDSTGIRLVFMTVSIKGLLFLAGILYAVTRLKTAINRSLLLLLGSIIPLIMLGSVLGATDHPINLIKAREMVIVFAGPFIGLMTAALFRHRVPARSKWVLPVLIGIVTITFVHQFNGFVKSAWVRTARTAGVPTWHTDSDEMADRAGSVFLSGHEEFASFYPVYYFISANEHYSNPASRMKARYDLLGLLEQLRDPYLLNLALRTNRYDRVDYLIPRRSDATYDFVVSLSNYPNRYSTRTFSFGFEMLTDSVLFKPETGDNLFKVMEAEPSAAYVPREGTDSLTTLMCLAMLRDHLTEAGQVRLDVYTGVDWSQWHQLLRPSELVEFGGSLQIKDIRIVPVGDSIHFLFAMEASKPMKRRLTAALHLAGTDFHNFDFIPDPPTNTWKQWHTVVCRKTVPRIGSDFRMFLGFFDRLGEFPGQIKRNCVLRKSERRGEGDSHK